MEEVWNPIPDYPGYAASNQGRIRSYYRPIGGGHSWQIAKEPQRIMTTSPKVSGYYIIQVKHQNGKTYSKPLHQLIASAFLGPQSEGTWVCHRNDNKLDNRAENLYYGTPLDNARDAFRNGGLPIKPKKATSQYFGVGWHTDAGKWRARIWDSFNHKLKHLGVFSDEIDASRAFDVAAQELHGDRAKLNFPDLSAVTATSAVVSVPAAGDGE